MCKIESDNFVTDPLVVSEFRLLVEHIELSVAEICPFEAGIYGDIALKMKMLLLSFCALNNKPTYLLSDFCSYFLSFPIHSILICHTLPV